jgi:hypothetical protein
MENNYKNQFSPNYAIDLFNQERDLKKWLSKKKQLPRNIRYGLLSLETEALIKNFCDKYNFTTPEKICSLSVLVRNFLSGQLTEEQLKKEIYQRFQLSNTVSLDFLKEFKGLIEKIKKIGLKEVKKDLVVLKFNDLMERIPAIKKQEIGVYTIVFPEENEKRRPSIENWITDYKLRKNDQQETAILNVSDYLYNNKNTQELNQQEKSKLAVILNAYEKNQIIYYNNLFEEIDFEIVDLVNKNKKNSKKYNITSFDSKPYHDVDKNPVREDSGFDKKSNSEFFSKKTNSEEGRRVLNLSKYL